MDLVDFDKGVKMKYEGKTELQKEWHEGRERTENVLRQKTNDGLGLYRRQEKRGQTTG